MGIVNGQQATAADFINRSQKDAVPANDQNRVPKLENDAKIHQDFIRGKNVISLTANEALTPGAPVGISNGLNGYVSKAFNKIIATLTPPVHTWSPNPPDITYVKLHWLTSNNFIVEFGIYGGGSGFASRSMNAIAGTINLTTLTISWGTAVVIVEDSGGSMNGAWGGICVVDTNKFIGIGQVYQGPTIYTYVCTVSGNTITVTASNNLSLATRTYNWFSSAQLNTNAGVFLIATTGASYSQLCSFTVSGTTVTWGTPLATTLTGYDQVFLCKVSATSFCFSYAATHAVYAATIAGGVITLGTADTTVMSYYYTSGQKVNRITYLSDGVVLFSYADYNTSNIDQHMRVCTISGTTWTAGTDYIFNATGAIQNNYVVRKSATTALLLLNNKAYDLTISGTTVTACTFKFSITNQSYTSKEMIYLNGYFAFINFSLSGITANMFVQGMATNFIGIAQTSASQGGSVDVLVGGVDENQSGLVAGEYYLVNNATLNLVTRDILVNSLDDVEIVKAISPTQIAV